MKSSDIQYVSDEKGDRIAVIVPIEIWEELTSGDETSYLLKSKTMKKRLLEAKKRQTGISLEKACPKGYRFAYEKLGI
ncbi:prevent-host-death protein [Pleurocapsales cyanobacterium LEGE 10410]|nr:prevent-host-death protein [Pleurocapsales cyanobacterium LEGE 10410]